MTFITKCTIHGQLTREQTYKRGKKKNKTQRYRCKICTNKSRDEYNKKHKDKVRERQNKYDLTSKRRNISRFKVYLKRKFNITIDQYNQMLTNQNYICLICKLPERRLAYRKGSESRLCVDHCHKTGKIRGLLCWSCNGMLGMARDSIAVLEEAINYLGLSRSETTASC